MGKHRIKPNYRRRVLLRGNAEGDIRSALVRKGQYQRDHRLASK